MNAPLLSTLHLGLEGRGLDWLRAAIASPLFQPALLADETDDLLVEGRALTGLGHEACFDEPADALEAFAPEGEVVIIALPARFHAEAIMAALALDKHVLVEPPLATTLEDAERCVRIAANRGARVMVAHTARHSPAWERLATLGPAREATLAADLDADLLDAILHHAGSELPLRVGDASRILCERGAFDPMPPARDPAAEARVLEQLHDYVLAGEEPPTNGRRCLKTVRVLEALARSRETGTPIAR